MVDQNAGNQELVTIIDEEIAANGGSVPFVRFMDLALYHPNHGYYMSPNRRPGRGGDFITSPEASPLFGNTLAGQMLEFWERLGRPAQWTILEHGAGIGGLAYDILAGLSQLSTAAFESMTYRLVEVNSAMRTEARKSMNEVGLSDRVTIEKPGDGFATEITGVILANEVADAFPATRLKRGSHGWQEAHVGRGADDFEWRWADASATSSSLIEDLESAEIDLPVGSVVDASPAAADWFAGVAATLERGFAMIVDYGYPAEVLYRDHRLQGTIRGYQGHTVTDDPLIRAGLQDLTAHVDFSALRRVGERQGMQFEDFTTQGAMLSSLDLGNVLLEMNADPDTTMQEYLATQAVVLRLIDPGGLGRFGVLIMSKNVDRSGSPLRSFRDAPPNF